MRSISTSPPRKNVSSVLTRPTVWSFLFIGLIISFWASGILVTLVLTESKGSSSGFCFGVAAYCGVAVMRGEVEKAGAWVYYGR